MYRKVAETMQWRADLLTAERFDDLAREYLLPMVMFQDNQQIVVTAHEELAGLFAQLRASHRSRGVARLDARVTAIDLPRQGRFRVWVRYYNLDQHGQLLSQSDVVQYCRDTINGLKTEMSEYGLCTLPEIWRAARAAPVQLG